MKTLKFMLAVATAVGLASAAQAAQNTGASTGFEKLAQGTKVGSSVVDNESNRSYFWYAGATADDNESEIVEAKNLGSVTRPTGVAKFTGADASSRANALQVSTGADPLLRTFLEAPADGNLTYDGLYTSTYVDTLVQFTVTPATDTVTPSAADKLMIYLKESEGETVENEDGSQTVKTATNLVVKAGYCGVDGVVTAKDYTVQNVTVEPGKWYRLTVQAIPDLTVEVPNTVPKEDRLGFVGFVVKIDNKVCNLGEPIYDAEDETAAGYFGSSYLLERIDNDLDIALSLLANSTTVDATAMNSLQAVGFAGEGLVDDLVITTTDPAATVVNFTLVTGEGINVVDYTIGGVPYGTNTDGKEIEDVPVGSTVTIDTVYYAEGYEFDSISGLLGLTAVAGSDNSFTVDANASAASLTINAKKVAAASEIKPGETMTADSKEAADALAEKLTIVATAPANAGITDADYASYFKKVVKDNGDGTFAVTVELDEDVVDPDSVAADLVNKFNNITTEGVEVVAKPGLYYSVMQGFDVKNLTEGERTLATGETVMLKADKFEDKGSGFYKIVVNIEDKQ